MRQFRKSVYTADKQFYNISLFKQLKLCYTIIAVIFRMANPIFRIF
jgi:hypothetical protein